MHFGGIRLAREPLASRLLSLAEAQRAGGGHISYDANFRRSVDTARYAPTFERLCRLADVIKLSDEDLRGLMPGLDAEAALRRVRSFNARAWLLYTEGAAGASLITSEGRWRAAAPPVAVVDTVGAGDASIAGLVASRVLRPQAGAATHLAFAVAAGSAACQTEGVHPPLRAAVQSLMQGRSTARPCSNTG
jgi:fructokinase